MAKTKNDKKALVEEYVNKLQGVETIYFVAPKGLSANQSTDLKKALFDTGSSFNVVKNTLFKIALEKAGLPVPELLEGGEHAVVFSGKEISEVAKLVSKHAEETEKMEIVGGLLNGEYITAQQVKDLADLPSKDQLLGQLLSVFNGPARGLVTVLSGNMREMVQVLSAIKDQKENA
ncbi:MAG: 50S ribosomal protein L10 [candidate division WS6 bacterium OLB20]|uniref:Large ribosomal subunit protein uL10 n=1 Tax=candidate division WS6 bacterium OLB20 TaxID=1617426 RepID=A0A136LYF5_9BACT|nr:MAG: 50S ribosomal protein L10 [candidate division WS6 bacterium OLB20]